MSLRRPSSLTQTCEACGQPQAGAESICDFVITIAVPGDALVLAVGGRQVDDGTCLEQEQGGDPVMAHSKLVATRELNWFEDTRG